MQIFKQAAAVMLAAVCALGAAAQWSPTKQVIDIEKPNMKVFLPKDELATGRAIVVCPGGSYMGHAIGHEGFDWAPFYNKKGIAVAVLAYTLPAGDPSKPIGDAEAAIRLLRQNAKEWGINPEQVGIQGSSAGGHLAATVSTHSTGDAAPNFQVLFYPVISMIPGIGHDVTHREFLGPNPDHMTEMMYSNEMTANAQTPRAFIATSDDDSGVPPINAALYYIALKRAGVPATLHIYPTGEHGWGIQESFPHHTAMLNDLSEWLVTF